MSKTERKPVDVLAVIDAELAKLEAACPDDSASRLTRRLIGSLVLVLGVAGMAGGAWLSGVL